MVAKMILSSMQMGGYGLNDASVFSVDESAQRFLPSLAGSFVFI
jgi:nitrous oxide reductase accessory protein NosL